MFDYTSSSSDSEDDEENLRRSARTFPSEVHTKLEYRAYKTEMEERYTELSITDDSRCVLEKVLPLKSSRFLQMWEKVTKAAEKKSEKPPEPLSEARLRKVSAREFLDATVFPTLVPAIEDTVRRAEENDCLKIQKCKFNGIDYIVEHIWNRNPKHPERVSAWKTVFEIPFVRERLAKHPRPIYPKSWLWSREEAAIVIQSGYRGYLVRRTPEVQEMRQFWKALEAEKEEIQRKKERAQQEFLLIMQGEGEELESVDMTDTSTEKGDELE